MKRSSPFFLVVRAVALAVATAYSVPIAAIIDCNGNRQPDESDIESGASIDCDADGVPDECELVAPLRISEVELPAGHAPIDVAPVDLDGDGLADLAVLTRAANDGTVVTFLNRGDRRFELAEVVSLESRADALMTADLDADGDLDIVTDRLAVLRNLGNGDVDLHQISFHPPSWTPLIASDLDGDGTPDLVIRQGVNVLIFFNSGDGTFRAPVALAMDGTVRSVHAGDLDGDGDNDLVVGTASASGILSNAGDGTFAELVPIRVGAADAVTLAVADIDGDGAPDIVRRADGPNMTVLFNDGAFTFTMAVRPISFALGRVFHESTAVRDVDGDGDADVLWSNGGELLLIRNLGARELAAPAMRPVGVGLRAFSLADLDGDGAADLAGVQADEEIPYVVLGWNDGDGTFRSPFVAPAGRSPSAVAAADLDRDGDLDLVTANSESGDVSVLLGAGDGTFAPEVRAPVGQGARDVLAADLDGDGDLDIAAAVAFAASVVENAGAGGFRFTQMIEIGSDPLAIAAGDLDGDGDADLVTSNVDGNVSVLRGDGSGSFAAPVNYASAGRGGDVAACDLDGDGDIDLAVGLIASFQRGVGLVALLNDGAGGFSERREISGPRRGEPSVLAGDFDGDGDVDLALAAQDFSYYENTGEGAFQQTYSRWFVRRYPGATVADVDGDGDLDILALAYSFTGLWTFINDGTGSFRQVVQRIPATRHTAVAAGDFDGDGAIDVAVTSFANPSVNVLPRRPATASDVNGNAILDECEVEASFRRGDANAGGEIDLGDASFVLNYLFLGGQHPGCPKSADANDSGGIELTDAVRVLNFLFLGGAPPAEPFAACGPDPTPDPLACAEYPPCN